MMHTEKTPARVRLAYAGVLPILALTMFACNPSNTKVLSPVAEETEIVPVVEEAPAAPEEAPVTAQTLSAPAPDQADEEEAVPFALVEVKPRFQGGDANAFAKWVSEHLTYPEEAREAGIAGRITVQFTVSKNGEVQDVKILRGVHPLLDTEAMRVIKSSPLWTPGKQAGRDIKVTYQFPVIFQLKES